jgi:mannose-6-phosphate isomerase
VKIRRIEGRALEKVWGTRQTEPWYPAGDRQIGEVWFTAPEEPRLLVKFLFTSGKLSVQVHPPDGGEQPGKTEMWHVLRADPGASVALGFVRPISSERVRAAAVSGGIESLLLWHTAQPGDSFFVPAGTVHAIGAGLALCEIQQNSDVTYRLYDYGRPRELHLNEALDVADLSCHPGPIAPVDLARGRSLLAECPYFRTELLAAAEPFVFPEDARAGFIICIDGAGLINREPFTTGHVWAVPAGGESIAVEPRAPVRLLRLCVP